LPREVHLTRAQVQAQPQPLTPSGLPGGPGGPGGSANTGNAGNAALARNAADEASKVRWDGTLVLSLPAR
ncbi:MAG: type II secretion system protein M, partial [Burkholderiaceae bacterium]